VIAAGSVENDWRNPDSVEAHAGNVVEVVDNTLESTTTVVSEIGAGTRVAVSLGESVGKELVDGTGTPFILGVGEDGGGEGEKEAKSEELLHLL